VEPYRERIEDFLRRYGRVLAVAVAILLALLVLRRLRVLASLVPIGALLLAVVLVAVAVSLADFLQTPTYEASAQVWVAQRQGDQQTYVTGSGEEIQTLPPKCLGELQALTLEMVHAIDSRPVAEETIQRLGLRLEPAELLDNLTVEQVESTSFIVLSYQSSDPVEATRIVNTVGEVSSELISERTVGSLLTANVYEEAMVPESPVSPPLEERAPYAGDGMGADRLGGPYSRNFVESEFSEVQHGPVPLPGALGKGRGVFSPKCKHWFVKRTSMIAHIYPSVLQAVLGRGYAGCLEGCFQG
jgi:capsular polysaccharide biosynthesis protein